MQWMDLKCIKDCDDHTLGFYFIAGGRINASQAEDNLFL